MKGNRKMKREVEVLIDREEMLEISKYFSALTDLRTIDFSEAGNITEIIKELYPDLNGYILFKSQAVSEILEKLSNGEIYQRRLFFNFYNIRIGIIELEEFMTFKYKTEFECNPGDWISLDRYNIQRTSEGYKAKLELIGRKEIAKLDKKLADKYIAGKASSFDWNRFIWGGGPQFDYRSWSNRMNSNYLRYRIGSHRLRR